MTMITIFHPYVKRLDKRAAGCDISFNLRLQCLYGIKTNLRADKAQEIDTRLLPVYIPIEVQDLRLYIGFSFSGNRRLLPDIRSSVVMLSI